jgi:hypothetical protein
MRARAIGPKSLLTLAMAMATHAVAVAKSKLSPASASVLIISVASENSKSLAARRSYAKPTAFGLRSGSGGLVTSLASWYLRSVTVPYQDNITTICIGSSERLEFGGAHVRRVRESFHVGNGLVDERLRDPETIEK